MNKRISFIIITIISPKPDTFESMTSLPYNVIVLGFVLKKNKRILSDSPIKCSRLFWGGVCAVKTSHTTNIHK